MHIVENVREGIKSIKSNLLRTVITAAIVALGIIALVGTLTAIEAMKAKVSESLAGLGANSFDIKDISRRRQNAGKAQKVYPIIKYKELKKFKQLYRYQSTSGISTNLSWTAEIKRFSKITNPNVGVFGADVNYLILENYDLDKGRNFSELEVKNGAHVVILGISVANKLFENEEPLGEEVSFFGRKFKVIGVLKEQGGLGNNSGGDRQVIIPIETANAMSSQRALRYQLTAAIDRTEELDFAMGEATGLMRAIRKDQLGKEESFEITKSDSLSGTLDDIAGWMRIVALVLGFVTLFGASICLMNIMMVSVTERTREIGVRKALGATPAKIKQQFLIEAIVICIMGGGFGVIFSIMLGNVVPILIGAGSFTVPWLWIIVGLIVCIGVGLVSGYLPARKAARLDPIESLRFE
ncbi:ABC transporter permease [Fulvivirgaceae bacterium BMA12]|uniref:ABC transporter permease n=1 Tax=Agaribacillus aureus TaxID=3051825 RepID=A0ABT8L1C0_9BACT|nr:ABC transporter permease [Fulvivirgaceae bacterium BMA12]